MSGGSGGRFIVLEGPDGCGKSTQAARLVGTLTARGRSVIHLRDPGGTRVGEKIRAILLDVRHRELAPRAEMLLFLASRAQLIEEQIRPALAGGAVVVCERWLHSTVCYQGYGGGLDPEEIWRIGEAAADVVPDRVLVLDVAPEVGLSRLSGEPDLLESRERAYHERVREGYREIGRTGRLGAVLIGAGDLETVEACVLEEVNRVL